MLTGGVGVSPTTISYLFPRGRGKIEMGIPCRAALSGREVENPVHTTVLIR